MSTTFTVEALPTGAFTAWCHDTDATLRADSYETILGLIEVHKAQCEECALYGMYAQAVVDVDVEGVNVSCHNARTILGMLGLGADDDDLAGHVSGAEFRAAVLLAQVALQDDSGVAPADLSLPGLGARYYDCGVRPGYYTETLARLAVIGETADLLGRSVHWS